MGSRHVLLLLAALLPTLAAQAPPAAVADACAELRRQAERAPLDDAAADAWIDFAYCRWNQAGNGGGAHAGLAAVHAALAHCADAPLVARARLRHLRGQMLRDAGRASEALGELSLAAAWLHDAGDGAGAAVCRTNLAAAWRDLGEWSLALAELEQAVQFARAAAAPERPAILENHARLLLALGDDAGALTALDEASALPTEPVDALFAAVLRADVLAARGIRTGQAADLQQAERSLVDALALGDREQLWPAPVDRCLVQQHLVVCLHRRGALAEALRHSTEVVAGLERNGSPALDATILHSHASLLAATGAADAARASMARAVTIAAEALRVACATGSERAVAARHADLRSLLSSVLSCPAGSEPAAARAANDLAVWLCSRGLSDWQHRRARRLAELARTDADLAARLAALRRSLQAPPAPDATAAAHERLQRDRLQRDLSAAAAVEPAQLPPDLAAIARLLPGDAVLLVSAHYLRAALAHEGAPTPEPTPHVALFTLTPHGVAQRFELGTAPAIADAVARERRAVQANVPVRSRGREPDTGAAAPAPTVLGGLLAPVLATLDASVRRLVVCPDGACAAAPWSAIALPEGGRLGDRFTIGYVDHPWALGDARPAAAPDSLLLLGDVDYGAIADGSTARQFAALTASATEIDAVAAVFADAFPGRRATVLRGDAATWPQFAAAVGGKRCVHLSTHGFVTASDAAAAATVQPRLGADDPLAGTGVALAAANRDPALGTATARQLAGLDLTDCELAVFACCDSNAGARAFGDALAGTAAAARAAGARSVIGTLWPIPDADAARFVGWFYDALWRQGLAPDTALAAAERRARAAGLSPAAWAAFVHYGPVSAP
ncbi:MAG: CHAT domain-containing protein [Planctomycetes bacterium]|nr:CHAT domain-containing protein [Planctomycetota bacterium]